MRAVTFTTFGSPDVIEVVDLPDRTAGPGEVLVAVEAASINPVDSSVRSGKATPPEGFTPPFIVGWDLAGHIIAVGEGVDAALIGSYVVGFSNWFKAGNGTQASLVALGPENYAVAPDSIPPAELTTLGLNALTAWIAVNAAEPKSGETVLVTGATGAVGGYVVEFAARAGAEVWAMAKDEDAELVTGFGASRVVPRDAAGAIAAAGDGVDIVIDTANLGAGILGAVRDGGRYFTVGQPPESERDVTVTRVGARANAAALAEIVRLAASGDIALRLEKTYPVDAAADAYRDFESGSHRGRIVLTF